MKKENVYAEYKPANRYFCRGNWVMTVDGVDVTDKIPSEFNSKGANTFNTYYHIGTKDANVVRHYYDDGLKQDNWIEENKFWLDQITTDTDTHKRIFECMNFHDWRPGHCGDCICVGWW